jgi:hypothetical protein
MLRQLLKSRIHRAAVTQGELSNRAIEPGGKVAPQRASS